MPPQSPPHLPPYDRTNIFAKILRGEAPCTKVYEDEYALAFDNIHPAAPIHVLVVPKGEYVSNADFCAAAPDALIAGFWRAVGRTAALLVANHGPDANQLVFHFHVHIIGGRHMRGVSGQAPRPGDGT
jgi:histidine triad (HIT) family protein